MNLQNNKAIAKAFYLFKIGDGRDLLLREFLCMGKFTNGMR
ncbi:hypothetical protein [Marinifilum breve]|nr:hypothetical protein [Marinifilum breve]